MATTSWSYPHDEMNTRDNTITLVNENINNGIVALMPYISDRGEDSVIVDWNSYEKFVYANGEPEFSIHGQAIYNAINWLKSGGVLKGCRLTAKNAKRANILVLLKINVFDEQKVSPNGLPVYIDKETGEEVLVSTGNKPCLIKKAKVKVFHKSIDEIPDDRDDVLSVIRTNFKMNENKTEYIIPLFLIYSKGRGSYGSDYRFRFVSNVNKDLDSSYRNFYIEIMDKNGNNIDNSPLNVSMYPNAKTEIGETRSEYLNDVISSYQEYPVYVITPDEYHSDISKLLLPIIQQTDANATEKDINFVTFTNREGIVYENIEIDKDTDDLTIIEGIALKGGDDGDFALDKENRDKAIAERYMDFFEGIIDESVDDRQEHIFLTCLDANFPLEVKKSMLMLFNRREQDFTLMLDCSTNLTYDILKDYLTNIMTPNTKKVKIFTHYFDTKDNDFTGKTIKVTSTYAVALKFPEFAETHKIYTPFAGQEVKLDDIIIKGSLKPNLSKPYMKDAIYKLRGNYIHKEKGHYVFGCDVSSQYKESDLSKFNNAIFLTEIEHGLYDVGADFRHRRKGNSNDYTSLNKILAAKMDTYNDGFKASEVEAVNDTRDTTGKTIRIVGWIAFYDYIEKTFIDLTVEKK